MDYNTKYIQFNELVFDTSMIINKPDVNYTNKRNLIEKSYGHGSYFVDKGIYRKPFTITLTIGLFMKKLDCADREFYNELVHTQFHKTGKLWRIHNNTLQWAFAEEDGISEINNGDKDYLEYDVNLVCYEGVWHKADPLKTFIKPYSVCDFMECFDFKTISPCDELTTDCCTDCFIEEPKTYEECICCYCNEITKEMALCFQSQEVIDDLKNDCLSKHQIVYNCEKSEALFGDTGQKIITKDSCSSILAGIVNSHTYIDTNGYTLILKGHLKDVSITINDNTNIIKGEYDGLVLSGNGKAFSGCGNEIDISNWDIPQGNEYGFTFINGNNRVIIENCVCGFITAYITIDEIM